MSFTDAFISQLIPVIIKQFISFREAIYTWSLIILVDLLTRLITIKRLIKPQT